MMSFTKAIYRNLHMQHLTNIHIYMNDFNTHSNATFPYYTSLLAFVGISRIYRNIMESSEIENELTLFCTM